MTPVPLLTKPKMTPRKNQSINQLPSGFQEAMMNSLQRPYGTKVSTPVSTYTRKKSIAKKSLSNAGLSIV